MGTESELEERKMERVYVEGIPDYKNEVYVGNDKPPPSSGINSIEYNWGGYVYTPITLKSGKTILMNRGWISEDDAMDCSELRQDSESPYCTFYGLLTPLEYVPEQIEPFDVAKIFWPFIHRLSINTRWSNINIPPEQVPVVVTVTDPKPPRNGLPVRMKERDYLAVTVTPSQHLSYVIFWYSMCAICWIYAWKFYKNPYAKNLFKRRFARPVLRRSDVLNLPERDIRL